jgi:hypothetical protein
MTSTPSAHAVNKIVYADDLFRGEEISERSDAESIGLNVRLCG